MSLPSITDASESKKKLQCAAPRPSSASERAGVVAEVEERQPAMADFLAEHAERVVLAEEALRGSSGYLPMKSMTAKLRSRPALPKSRDGVEGVDADTADLVGDGRFVGERVRDQRGVASR